MESRRGERARCGSAVDGRFVFLGFFGAAGATTGGGAVLGATSTETEEVGERGGNGSESDECEGVGCMKIMMLSVLEFARSMSSTRMSRYGDRSSERPLSARGGGPWSPVARCADGRPAGCLPVWLAGGLERTLNVLLDVRPCDRYASREGASDICETDWDIEMDVDVDAVDRLLDALASES